MSRAKWITVYGVTHEDMTTYFGRKQNAQRFNSLHEEPAEIETHVYDAHRLADLLNAPANEGTKP